MTPARVGERELVQPVRERSPADLDAEFIADREVRQTEPAGRVFLREVDVALGAVQGTPLAHSRSTTTILAG